MRLIYFIPLSYQQFAPFSKLITTAGTFIRCFGTETKDWLERGIEISGNL